MDDSALALDAEINKLEESINNAKLPQDLLEKTKGMLDIIKISVKQGGNIGNLESIANYIDVITKIAFVTESKDNLDLNLAKVTLDKNHYGLQTVKDRMLEYMASLILNTKRGQKNNRAPIICLVGLVGTGKTTLSYSLAQALGRNFERIPLGGVGDVRFLRGQSRVFPDAEPGLIIKKLMHAKVKNPVILIDELDRVTEAARADIMGALVELLDPEQNSSFVDHFVDYPVDLSQVIFIATANNTTNISTAVLDRLEIIQMPAYSDQEKIEIGKSYLFPKISKNTGLPDNLLKIDESVWPIIIRPLGYDSGIRSLERTIEGISRKVARLLVEGKIQQNVIITITSQNIKEYLPH